MDITAFVQPLTIVLGLLIVNGFVFALFVLEHKKVRATEVLLEKTLTENQKVVTALLDDFNSHKKVLEEIVLSSKGFAEIDKAQIQAAHIVEQSIKQTEQIAKSSISLQNELHQRMTAIEDQAQTQLAELVATANTKAQELIQSAIQAKGSLEQGIDQALAQSVAQSQEILASKANEMLNSYQQALMQTQQQQIERMDKIHKEINDNAEALVTKFFEQMRQTILEVGSEKRDYMELQLVKINEDLQVYKQDQMAKIESNIYEILARASESVIGQAVNFDLHQELIIKALEQAKREGVFL